MRTPTKVFIGSIVAFTLLIICVSVGDGSASPQAPSQLPQESIGKDGAPMVLVPAGEFVRGSPPGEGDDDEHPQKRIYLDAFYMDKYEVTTARYADFLRVSPREKPEYWEQVNPNKHGNLPVVGVNWDDARAYCEWAGKRLPTEAEWEKAARGTDGRKYPWGNQSPTPRLANYDKDWSPSTMYKDRLAHVDGYDSGKSPYAVYHMAGNVWEWVADWYDKNYYSTSPNRNPKGPNSSERKVLRGGSWITIPRNLRSALRYYDSPPTRLANLGVRCAQDAP